MQELDQKEKGPSKGLRSTNDGRAPKIGKSGKTKKASKPKKKRKKAAGGRAKTSDQRQSRNQTTKNGDDPEITFSLGRAKPAYAGPQVSHIDNPRGTADERAPPQPTSLQRVVEQQEQARPGAFRVFGIRLARDDSSSSSSDFFNVEGRSLPLAHVERHNDSPNYDQDNNDEGEPFEPEQQQVQQHNHHGSKKKRREDHFWVIAAGIFGLLIIIAVVATTVLVRVSGGDSSPSLPATSPTPSPAPTQSPTSFDALKMWDDSSYLFVFAVQFGSSMAACTTENNGIPPAPRIQMTCHNGGQIGILGSQIYGKGEVLNEDQYFCQQSSRSMRSCSESWSATRAKRPSGIWIVGCSYNITSIGTGLDVESTLDFSTSSLTCQPQPSDDLSFSLVSHSISTGSFCFQSSVSGDFNQALECPTGAYRDSVGLTEEQWGIPFCLQYIRCSNTNSEPCSISSVDSFLVNTNANQECALEKDVDESFEDLINTAALWDRLEAEFSLKDQFGKNAHRDEVKDQQINDP